MQKVRTVTMMRLHEEAGHRIATEQLIVISLEEDILGAERQALISWDLLAVWAGLDQIDIAHIFVWMKILKLRVISEKNIPSDQYGFMCPYVLSLFIPDFSFEQRVDYIAQQLATTKKLIFGAYNEKGTHWVLAAIMPTSNKVFWLDSLHHQPSETFKHLINMAFKKKRANEQDQPTEDSYVGPDFITITWAPRQPDSIQCGYYACRFMLEIIRRRYLVIPEKYAINPSTVERYSSVDIDEVRDMWGNYVLEYIRNA
ncbi:uncharacterized protein LOC141609065 [Silene latifolia]|uniref:uncharacterized protein LOC141609065 n=1 Tax=Silene latifolia TaxID=37657 RepID=UPI003D78610A